LAAEKKLELKVKVPKDLMTGKGDEQRIAQVLLNLLGNAIKFTEKGEVRVEATVSNKAFLVSVSDTGPGLSEADQKIRVPGFRKPIRRRSSKNSTRPTDPVPGKRAEPVSGSPFPKRSSKCTGGESGWSPLLEKDRLSGSRCRFASKGKGSKDERTDFSY
jgi:hypothetical protein